jgi:hypothetical protein
MRYDSVYSSELGTDSGRVMGYDFGYYRELELLGSLEGSRTVESYLISSLIELRSALAFSSRLSPVISRWRLRQSLTQAG